VVLNAPLTTEIAVQTPLNFYLFQRDLKCPFQTIIMDRRRQPGASVIGINNNHTQHRATGKRLLHILARHFSKKHPYTTPIDVEEVRPRSVPGKSIKRKQKHHPTCVAVVFKLPSSCLLHRLSISKRFS
jgi:hypothetical protein